MNDPKIGDVFDPTSITITAKMISDYANATGDVGFGAHAASIKLATGLDIAPPTILDRDMGSRIHQNYYTLSYALHAKQEFHFLRPLEQGFEYQITGRVTNVYSKNGTDYFTFEAQCRSLDGELVARTVKTSGFRFPGGQYTARSGRTQLDLRTYLAESKAVEGAKFPEIGSIVEGTPLHLTRAIMNLYSGPHSGHHTDAVVARRKGHKDSIAQGLGVSAVEARVYREIFGVGWYSSGVMSLAYIKPIVAESILTPIGVVTGNVDGRVTFRSAVFDQDLDIVTIGTVSSTGNV